MATALLSLQTYVAAVTETTPTKFAALNKAELKRKNSLLPLFFAPLSEFRPSASLLLQGWGQCPNSERLVFSPFS